MHTHTHTHTHIGTKWVIFDTKWQQSVQNLDALRFEAVAAFENVATSKQSGNIYE
jgi:hypothetical protein